MTPSSSPIVRAVKNTDSSRGETLSAPLTIRDFTLADHEQVIQVALDSWMFAYHPHYSAEAIQQKVQQWYSLENHRSMVARVADRRLYFKVAEAGRIEGYVAGSFDDAVLLRLYVRPVRTRNGLGGTLLKGFLEELRGRGSAVCETACDKMNAVGLSFYQKNGFVITGEDEEDYLLRKHAPLVTAP